MDKKQNIKSKTAFMVRDLDPMYIEQLDRKAKALSSKLNRKVSREEYVRMILEGDQAMPMYELQKKLLEDTIDRFTRIMEVQTDTFERYKVKVRVHKDFGTTCSIPPQLAGNSVISVFLFHI